MKPRSLPPLQIQRETLNAKDVAMNKLILTKKMTGKEDDAELARLKARHHAAGNDTELLNKIAEAALACATPRRSPKFTASEFPGRKIKADVMSLLRRNATGTRRA